MENLGEKPKQERSIEKDKQSFIEAISAIPIEEIPTEFDESTCQNLATDLEKARLLILGEMHGVKENADIIYTLFKRFGFRHLALEWEPELKEVVEKFLMSGELDFDAIKDSPDGRITAGHFALIKKLKNEGLLEHVTCFDEGSGGGDWNKRDETMAKNILANLSNLPTLVVAGNLHVKIEPIAFDDEPGEHHPMGENVKKEISDVPTGEIEYLTGEFHNYGAKKFGELPEGGKLPNKAKFYRKENGLYVFELPNAHLATVPDPDERS